MVKTEDRILAERYLDVVGLAYKLVDTAKKHLNQYLGKYHVKFSHWYLLKLIMYDEAKTPSALALCMGTDRAAVTRLLDDLEMRQLIVRKPNKQDRRVVTVDLTGKGRSLVHKGIEHLTTLPILLIERLDSKELNTIRQLKNYHCENELNQSQVVKEIA